MQNSIALIVLKTILLAIYIYHCHITSITPVRLIKSHAATPTTVVRAAATPTTAIIELFQE